MSRAKGPKYVVHFRRRRKGLTDYKRRVALVKSGLPRLVVRCSTRHVSVQLVEFKPQGDEVIAYASSKELAKYGWLPKRNSPTAYLTGLLCGLRAKKRGTIKFVMDTGLAHPSKNCIMFISMKGVLDAGLETKHEKSVVSDVRVMGTHIAEYARTLKERDAEQFKWKFSDYIKNNIDPEKLDELFKSVKQKILEA